MARSRSEPGSASCSARKRAGSILCGAVIAWTPFKSTVRGLKKDHAMTAYVVDATPVTASPARARRTPLSGTRLRGRGPPRSVATKLTHPEGLDDVRAY